VSYDPNNLADALTETVTALAACDGYLVLVHDAQTGEIDAHGPFDGLGAVFEADRARLQFEVDELDDIAITISRLHHPVAP
jgi:hypothetical protein